MSVSAPRWDLTNVYPALDSSKFKSALKSFKKQLDELEAFLKKAGKQMQKPTPRNWGKFSVKL